MDPTPIVFLVSVTLVSAALSWWGQDAIFRMGQRAQQKENQKLKLQALIRRHEEVMGEFHFHSGPGFGPANQKVTQLQYLIRSENAQTRSQIQQLSTILMAHSHDTDGNIILRVPPPTQEE